MPDENQSNDIRTTMETIKAIAGGVSAEMPRYKCHKEVWALKIKEVRQAPADQERVHAGGDWLLVPEDARYAPICVGHDFETKHSPQPGGYYVVYADGYKSYSPAKAFEEGYTLITLESLLRDSMPNRPADFVWSGDGENIICEMGPHGSGAEMIPRPDAETQRANAHLIAAAPELLRAAQIAHSMLARQLDKEGYGPDWWGDDEHEAFTVLGKAISLAMMPQPYVRKTPHHERGD